MSNNIYKEKYHYVYLLIDENHKKYGGVRSCKELPENDSYMSSSKLVKKSIDNGNIFKKYIIKTFDTRKEANEYESHWLNNVKASKNNNWYNQINAYPNFCNAGKIPWNKGKTHMTGKNNPNYGKKFSKERRKEMSELMKGNIPWNKGKTGIYSKETKKKMSESRLGKSPWNKGKTNIYSEEIRKKIGVKKGNIPWNKGKTNIYSEETKKKMSDAQKLRRN